MSDVFENLIVAVNAASKKPAELLAMREEMQGLTVWIEKAKTEIEEVKRRREAAGRETAAAETRLQSLRDQISEAEGKLANTKRDMARLIEKVTAEHDAYFRGREELNA